MKKQYTKVFAILLTMAVSIACSDEVEYKDDIPNTETIRALIANEGQYGQGTASLTALTTKGEVKQDLFRAANSRPIGDVAQSVMELNGNYYVTLNNSKKVEVMDAKTFKSVETIELADGSIPTYMMHLGGDSIAVTDKGVGMLHIIDANHSESDNVKVRRQFSIGSANQMKIVGDKLFVAGSRKLMVFTLGALDVAGMREVKDVDKSSIPNGSDSKIVVDKNGNLWVYCSKLSFETFKTETNLLCIDPVTEKVIKTISMKGMRMDGFGGRLDILPGGTNLIINPIITKKEMVDGVEKDVEYKGVMKMSIDATAMPDQHLFTFPAYINTIYNMTVSNEGTIFICDVITGSLARGKVHELSLDGAIIRSVEAGIFPQYIHFPNLNQPEN